MLVDLGPDKIPHPSTAVVREVLLSAALKLYCSPEDEL